jgi:hypothetical protein
VNRILNVANTFRERGGGHVGLGDTWAWENRGWNRQDLQLSWLKLVLVCVKSYMRVWQWWCILERPALFCFRPLDPAWSCNQPLDSTLKELRAAVAQLLLHACSAGSVGRISVFFIPHQFSLSLFYPPRSNRRLYYSGYNSSVSVFSPSVSIIIPYLIILEFNSCQWI